MHGWRKVSIEILCVHVSRVSLASSVSSAASSRLFWFHLQNQMSCCCCCWMTLSCVRDDHDARVYHDHTVHSLDHTLQLLSARQTVN